MLPDDQIRLLMLMQELESALARLYMVFSASFPEHNNLWNTLIKEEQEHAEAIRILYKMTFSGESLFNAGSLKNAAVQSILDYVNDTCDRAKQGKFTSVQAVSTTYDVESSLIEKDLFKHFEVSDQLTEMFQYLQTDSERHVQLAKKELDKIQRG